MTTQNTTITARVNKIVYPRPEALAEGVTTFYIIRCDVGTVKGRLSHIPKAGETLTLDGKWGLSKYNSQPEFLFFHAKVFIPVDECAVLHYACEMTKGFGAALEDAIWQTKGEKWRDLTLADDIKGLTQAKLNAFRATIEFISINAAQAETVSWLCQIGCTLRMAESAFHKWGAKTMERVKADCYSLAQLPNYGFADVDTHIRDYFKIERNDARRINACLFYYMGQLAQENTTIDWDSLYEKVHAAIDSDPEKIADACRALMGAGRIVAFVKSARLASIRDYKNESLIWQFARENHPVASPKARQPIGSPFKLDASQMAAVQFALDNSLSIINGGAGFGKTTIVKSICDSLGANVELCAFAGKAAARLREATAHEAGTIHRMLNYMGEEQGFARKSLQGSTVIVDEASMVSSDLMTEIIKRKPERLILVGDEAQLPPVGSGQPFHDLIAFRPDLVRTLTTCYRNKEAIFTSALAIRQGLIPPPNTKSEQELYDVRAFSNPRDTHAAVLDCVRQGLVDFDTDIILCCRNGEDGDTACSILGFNRDIKDIVNPNADGSYRIQSDDRVICTKNCPTLDVWNGTTGRCSDFDTDGAMWVDLDFATATGDTQVLIPRAQVKDWQLAYALTVHKSQGSQYRKVFFVVSRRDTATLLSRPMLYTAVTRAKNECHIIGDTRAFQNAIGVVSHKKTVIQELAQ